MAVKEGHWEVVRVLLTESQINAEATNFKGWNPNKLIKKPEFIYTDRNILDNSLQVVIYLALVANIYCETWEKNVLQVNCYT